MWRFHSKLSKNSSTRLTLNSGEKYVDQLCCSTLSVNRLKRKQFVIFSRYWYKYTKNPFEISVEIFALGSPDLKKCILQNFCVYVCSARKKTTRSVSNKFATNILNRPVWMLKKYFWKSTPFLAEKYPQIGFDFINFSGS